ncbi:hypothetical protein [Roseivivax sediminis]|uniref:Uncharacterized protein n=1 Tax=Roseivivax sediminis TaxID=936889 RepID=A0A1I1XBU9_9RHOB|nr:hypothetical protein [Roseivivax sediminis]SFE02850.1 hypothetical protein SAMN04515678_105253 [Roseivivax sediminis]
MNDLTQAPLRGAVTRADRGPTTPPDSLPGLRLAKAWMDIGVEAWSFAARRMNACADTMHALLRAGNPIDAQVVLLRHGHVAVEDYRREAGCMIRRVHDIPGAAVLIDE